MPIPQGLLWYDAVQMVSLLLLFGAVSWLASRSIRQGEQLASLGTAIEKLESNHIRHIEADVLRIKKHLGMDDYC